MVSFRSIVALSLSVACAQALTASTISGCPALAPRASPPKDVTDLRIDDFNVVAALGDSITAGFAMMGVNYGVGGTGALNFSLISEYRGNSYSIGADTGAVTLPNFMKHYHPGLLGGSVLSHFVSYCSGTTCGFPETIYRPTKDNLNGAISGSIAYNLDTQLDYLIPRMLTYSLSENYFNDWKLITIQIGSNDQCASCDGSSTSLVTPDAYAGYVEAAIKKIKSNIPRVVVNLLGTFKVSGVFPLSAGQSYCVPNGILENKNECGCATVAGGLAAMDAISDAYNAKLQAIATKYSGVAGGSFAVMYNPLPINLGSFPITALSNVDCFHPALSGHQWIAKTVWNQLFTPLRSKPTEMDFDPNLSIYCPVDTDRLPTTNS